MAQETLPERLKRLQEQLLRLYAEAVELSHEAESGARLRRHNELNDRRVPSRLPGLRRRTDSDPSAS